MTVMETRGGARVSPMEHEIGEWVKHCEHAARIAALEAERQSLQMDYESAIDRAISCDMAATALEAEVQKLRGLSSIERKGKI